MKAPHLAALLWLLVASPALAGGDHGTGPFEPFDAVPVIADCWDRSDHLPGMHSAAAYRNGLDSSSPCLAAAVHSQIDRKVVVLGKSGSIRVNRGGRRDRKPNKKNKT